MNIFFNEPSGQRNLLHESVHDTLLQWNILSGFVHAGRGELLYWSWLGEPANAVLCLKD